MKMSKLSVQELSKCCMTLICIWHGRLYGSFEFHLECCIKKWSSPTDLLIIPWHDNLISFENLIKSEETSKICLLLFICSLRDHSQTTLTARKCKRNQINQDRRTLTLTSEEGCSQSETWNCQSGGICKGVKRPKICQHCLLMTP